VALTVAAVRGVVARWRSGQGSRVWYLVPSAYKQCLTIGRPWSSLVHPFEGFPYPFEGTPAEEVIGAGRIVPRNDRGRLCQRHSSVHAQNSRRLPALRGHSAVRLCQGRPAAEVHLLTLAPSFRG
jgi:hypothetical protein